jgi:hypothetical protein
MWLTKLNIKTNIHCLVVVVQYCHLCCPCLAIDAWWCQEQLALSNESHSLLTSNPNHLSVVLVDITTNISKQCNLEVRLAALDNKHGS